MRRMKITHKIIGINFLKWAVFVGWYCINFFKNIIVYGKISYVNFRLKTLRYCEKYIGKASLQKMDRLL